MMSFRVIDEEDAADWAASLVGLSHGIAHTHGFATLMARAQGTSARLWVAEGTGETEAKAVVPFAVRQFADRSDLFSPYGFGGIAGRGCLAGLYEAWHEFARKHKHVAAYLLLNPVVMPDQVPNMWGHACHAGREAYIMDLTKPEAERLKHVSRRKRTELQRWLTRVKIETDQSALAQAFVTLYPAFAKRKNMPRHYHFAAEILHHLTELPETILVGIRDESDEIACVGLFSTLPACGDYLFMASKPDAEADSFGTLWLGLRALAERGVKVCNLGGGIQVGDGVAEMKRRIGGKAQPILSIQQVFDPEAYQALCGQAGVVPESTTYFPAYYAPSGRVNDTGAR